MLINLFYCRFIFIIQSFKLYITLFYVIICVSACENVKSALGRLGRAEHVAVEVVISSINI